jgi:wyosine [tRNA(Phe)-imidazoG37] synthetase (radical SAM superfamily)
MPLPLQVDILYGPVNSRRLGKSLGINLMPGAYKLCSFNCVYCHYGWTREHTLDAQRCLHDLPPLEGVLERIRLAVRSALDFDYLTFSGNGEPTLYPWFGDLVREVVRLCDQYRPQAKVALLSNSAGLVRAQVRDILHLIDVPVFKLDAGTPETFRQVNRPAKGVDFAQLLDSLASVSNIFLQTLLVDGTPSNISEAEMSAYFELVARIGPQEVQLYSIDRPVPDPHLLRVPPQRLEEIARRGEQRTGARMKAFWVQGPEHLRQPRRDA